MKAIVCTEWGGPDRLRVETLPDPVPGEGQVAIRVRAAGVNFPDVLIIQRKYQLRPDLPFVPGAEVAGEILSVGPGVSGLHPGQRVLALCTLGGFAEQALAPAINCHVLPDGVPYDLAAAFLLAYGTAWHALLDRGAAQPGETLLVLGASGGVGLAALDIARAHGLRTIAAASSAGKLAVCAQHGAAALINYTEENLREAITRHAGKRGPDIIFDPVGGNLSEPAFRSIAWRGRYLVIGFADGTIPALPLNLTLLKGASVVGVFWGDHVRREPERYRADADALLAMLAAGRLSPQVSATYTLDQTQAALTAMAARQVIGKIVIKP